MLPVAGAVEPTGAGARPWSLACLPSHLDRHGDLHAAIGVATYGLAAQHGLEHLAKSPLAQSAVAMGCDEGFVHLHLFPVDLFGEKRLGPSIQTLYPLLLDGFHKLHWGLAPLPSGSVRKPREGNLVVVEYKVACVVEVEFLRHFDQESWLLTVVDYVPLLKCAALSSGFLSIGLGAKHQNQLTSAKQLGNFFPDAFGIVHINNDAQNGRPPGLQCFAELSNSLFDVGNETKTAEDVWLRNGFVPLQG